MEVDDEAFPPLKTQASEVVDRDENINKNFTRRSYSHTARRGATVSASPQTKESPRPVWIKNPVNPVFNTPEYQKGLVSEFERLITELIKITQKISIENNNTEVFKDIQGLKSQFEVIIANRDEAEISGSYNQLLQDEDSSI